MNASWYEHEAMYATRERARGGGASSSSSSASGVGVKSKRSRRPPFFPPSLRYVGDPNAPRVFHPHTPIDAPNPERSWIIVSIYATKREPTPAWTDEYPYLVDSEDT